MSLDSVIGSLESEITSLRRTIHQNPELGWLEQSTSATIAAFLERHGYQVKRAVGTGLIVDLEGTAPVSGPRKRIVVRADLDALPVQELTELPFASANAGVMHCCGHDVHMAVVAGLAATLAQVRDTLPGDVRFIFQPAEEGGRGTSQQSDPSKVNPNPKRAALQMMDAGALDGAQAVVGVHCWPDLPVGSVGADPKAAMAGNGMLRVKIVGKGGHGATPHKTVDPVPVTAQVILALQTIASRKNNPSSPFVLTIGTIHGGTTSNVIPDFVEFAATLRSYVPGYIENEVKPLIENMIRGIAEANGATAEIVCAEGLPPVINDKAMVDAFLESATQSLGKGKAVLLDEASMTSEDYAYYAQALPSVYIKLGVAGEAGCYPLHNARFSPDERSIAVGIKATGEFVKHFLAK